VEVLLIAFELVGEIVLEVLLELELASLKETFRRENRAPVLATAGYFVLGGVLGGLSVLWLPGRILEPGLFRGVSLAVAPAVAALFMDWWGQRRRAAGHSTTNLATWYGGGGLAFGLSLVRFLLVR
jgi:hypothetical protein